MSVMNNIVKDIRPFMKQYGFSLTQKCFYRIENDLAYCVEIEKPSALVYVTCYIIPLYIPTEHRYYTYGTRMTDKLLTVNANTDVVEQWCERLKKNLQNRVFPVFDKIQSPCSFEKVIEEELLFKKCDFHVSEVDTYRLRLFTSFYKADKSSIPRLCDEYAFTLLSATYLTVEAKEKLFNEIEEIRNTVVDTQKSNEIITYIIEETKKNCFKTGDKGTVLRGQGDGSPVP